MEYQGHASPAIPDWHGTGPERKSGAVKINFLITNSKQFVFTNKCPYLAKFHFLQNSRLDLTIILEYDSYF